MKNSRFIAFGYKAGSRDSVDKHLQAIRGRFGDANHHCFAYRLGPGGNDFRYDDDGEPAGTAGPPILRQIDSFRLIDTLVVVVRYFGGTKLGAGGLIRAYGGAAKEVLSNAKIVETLRRVRLKLTFGYDATAAVAALMNRYDAIEVNSKYSDHTELEVAIPVSNQQCFVDDFIDSVRGQGDVTLSDG